MVGLIIGTAGHVDHGKTALIRALTGVDTDRLQEEKERGLSVDLGFARLVLPSGRQVGVVDVPGHERFMANMLAGVTGMDLVMLIIDLTEGVMPQTKEHLEVIDLLDIKNGLVVLAKADLVEDDWIELVEEEVREELSGTTFAHAPMVVVSAKTGRGIDKLLQTLDTLIAETPSKDTEAPLRLPIDRAFLMPGLGTIITGTLVSGRIAVGEEVELLPSGLRGKVRQIQIHNESMEMAEAGQRVALNLPGMDQAKIRRGDVVLQPGAFQVTKELDVNIKLLPDFPHAIKDNSYLHFHLGTARLLAKIRFYESRKLEQGQAGLARLFLAEPVIASFYDPFIVRFYSPAKVMGGGRILVPRPPVFKRKDKNYLEMLRRLTAGNPADLLYMTLKLGVIMNEEKLHRQTKLTKEEFAQGLKEITDKLIELADNYLIAKDDYEDYKRVLHSGLKAYHKKYNLRPGMPKSQISSFYPAFLAGSCIDSLLLAWQKEDIIKIEGNIVSLISFSARAEGKQKVILDELFKRLACGKYSPPSIKEISLDGGDEFPDLLGYMVRAGEIVKVSEDIYFTKDNYQNALDILRNILADEGSVTVADYRNALATSRKYALALLEHFDDLRITRRDGDERVAGAGKPI